VRGGGLWFGVGVALKAAVEGDAADRSDDAPEERGRQADDEAGEVTLAEHWDEDAGGASGGESERQREEGASAANDDGSDDPGQQPDDAPAEEEE
jgi:hypothetical protein